VVGLSAHGHVMPPDGFIGPHFDVRFFMMTEEERLAIPAPPAAGFDVIPPSGYLPPNYVKNSAQAQIGRHWAENIYTAGQTVNSAMVYGTWNGQVTFLAPYCYTCHFIRRTELFGSLSTAAILCQAGLLCYQV